MTEPWLPSHESRITGEKIGARFRELHLYHGSKCNRACDFCTVSGHPDGWYEPFRTPVLDRALALVDPDGNLKVYGGEPTLELADLLDAIRYLRAGGFTGWITVFSNGVLADRVIALLEADPTGVDVFRAGLDFGVGRRGGGWFRGLTTLTCFMNLAARLDPGVRTAALYLNFSDIRCLRSTFLQPRSSFDQKLSDISNHSGKPRPGD